MTELCKMQFWVNARWLLRTLKSFYKSLNFSLSDILNEFTRISSILSCDILVRRVVPCFTQNSMSLVMESDHCVKNVQIPNFIWSLFSRIQSKYGKIRTRKNSAFRHFSRIGHLCEWYFLTLSWRRLINQWIGFYMIKASVMKGLSKTSAYLFQLRSRHPEVFCKKGALRNFTKFTELEVLRNF